MKICFILFFLITNSFALKSSDLKKTFVQFSLHTSPTEEVSLGRTSRIIGGFNTSIPLKLIVPGFISINSTWMEQMKNEIFKREPNVHVLILKWTSPDKSPIEIINLFKTYEIAVDSTRFLAANLTNYIDQINSTNVHCIGHSIGAHICGFIGKNLQKINKKLDRISALDPAGVGFIKIEDKSKKLDKNDANYVDVYHTNQGDGTLNVFFLKLGYSRSIGHADIIVGNGMLQPTCKKASVCSHSKAHDYYIDSIHKTNCSYGYNAQAELTQGEIHVEPPDGETICPN